MSWTFLAGVVVSLQRPVNPSVLWVLFLLGVCCFFVAAWMWASLSEGQEGNKTLWGKSIFWMESFEKLRTYGGAEVVWETSQQKLMSFSSLSKLRVSGDSRWNAGWVANHSDGPLELMFIEAQKSVSILPSHLLRFSLQTQPPETLEIRAQGSRVFGWVCFQRLSDRLDS